MRHYWGPFNKSPKAQVSWGHELLKKASTHTLGGSGQLQCIASLFALVSLLPLSFFPSSSFISLFFLRQFPLPVLSLGGPPAPLGHCRMGSEYQPKESRRASSLARTPRPLACLPSLSLPGLQRWMSPACSWPPCWSACASSLPTATWYLRKSPEMTGD